MLTHKELVTMVTVCFFELLTLAFVALAGPRDGITVSIFAVSTQQLSDSCTRLSSSKHMTLLRCSAACGISPGCKSIACVPDSSGTCQCFLCFRGQGVGQMRLTSGGTPPDDCGFPPSVRNSDMTYSSIKINSTVTYTCRAPYNYIIGSTSTRCETNGTWTQATLVCSTCTSPPLIPRTKIRYLDTNYTAVNYTCLDVDIYISGTTSTSCTNGIWGTVSILCASTSCWFQRPGGLPAYKGTTSTTATGINCTDWSNSQPIFKQYYYTIDSSYVMDGSKANAKNYCRIFDDGYKSTWCYTTVPGVVWADCNVPECPNLPGVLTV